MTFLRRILFLTCATIGLVVPLLAIGQSQDFARVVVSVGQYAVHVPVEAASARFEASASSAQVGSRKDQLPAELHDLASAGLSAIISQPASGDPPAWQTELWSRQGRHADFRFDPVGNTDLFRAYHPENPGIWTILSTIPTDGPMPPDFVVAECGGGEGAPAICRSTFWLASDLMVEYAYDARDLARRGEIERYLTAQIRSWIQPE